MKRTREEVKGDGGRRDGETMVIRMEKQVPIAAVTRTMSRRSRRVFALSGVTRGPAFTFVSCRSSCQTSVAGSVRTRASEREQAIQQPVPTPRLRAKRCEETATTERERERERTLRSSDDMRADVAGHAGRSAFDCMTSEQLGPTRGLQTVLQIRGDCVHLDLSFR